ncbi:MAG: phospholipid/cholesterol/gamma-HCH transport system substrate-binding protein [Solirubrobacterales bacterium]|jgi:ABC-type transporter Mla subunit MlaD|nr:phospholipid/cholesterol/gamma-HCH transport system substrate-binding protein [Solirubrobacterales bacterium]
MRRSGTSAITASPTMVGAVTTLIVIVAVFLAYNANAGLPFVPVYRVSVEIPDAARLTNNNEIRIGGHRVGVVESIDAIQDPTSTATAQASGDPASVGTSGGAVARLNLKLDKDAEPLPKDSVFRVRYRSSFGLKYLEIIRGTGDPAPEGFTFNGLDDATDRATACFLPGDPRFAKADNAQNGCFQPQTEFDQIGDTFDTKTRTNSRTNLVGFGDAFAGRGTSLNDAINSLEPLFKGLKPVTKVLNEPGTEFRRFFPELGDAARIVAPVAIQNADFFTKAGIAFAAISSDPAALEASISEGVPTLQEGIDLLPRERPFLRDFATLSRALRPGVTDLRATLPVLNEAITVGTPVLQRSASTSEKLEGAMRALNRLVSQPTTKVALQRLGETFDVAKPLAKYVAPAQTVCNYWNYDWTYLANGLSDHDQVGGSFRQMLAGFPSSFDVDAPATGYSAAQSNGLQSAGQGGKFEPYKIPILNAHAYAPTGQHNADCQGGQFGYALGQGLVPGQAVSNPAYGVSDLPGSRGPTTLFTNDAGQRELRDTRIPSRQPETWGNGQ